MRTDSPAVKRDSYPEVAREKVFSSKARVPDLPESAFCHPLISMKKITLGPAIAFVLLYIASFPLHGQQGEVGFSPYLEVVSTGDADLEDAADGAGLESSEWTVGLETFWRGAGGQLAFDASYGQKEADWSGDAFYAGLASASLFEEVESVALSGLWTTDPRQQWGYTIYLGLESSYATASTFGGADLADAIGYDLGAGVSYRYSESLFLTAGLRYQDNPAGVDDDWLPFIGLTWLIDERWTLRTRNGIFLDYQLGADWLQTLTPFVKYVSDIHHLGEASGAEVAYEEEQVAAGLAASIEFAEGWEIRPAVQYLFARESTLWQGGREVLETDLEETLRLSLRLGYSF
jgi:hypothetical protein